MRLLSDTRKSTGSTRYGQDYVTYVARKTDDTENSRSLLSYENRNHRKHGSYKAGGKVYREALRGNGKLLTGNERAYRQNKRKVDYVRADYVADGECGFLLIIAVMVVTSSGREVPTAMRVTAITLSSTPSIIAILLPYVTIS